MAFKPEQEVQPENIEMIGCPVQESSCVKTRPWPSSDKQSHNHPGAVDTLGTNSKPVFAHDEEMTKTGVEEEGLAVCEMMEKVEGVEEGKMEKKAEEKVAEAKLGVLCSLVDMPGSCLSQEAEPQSPTMDEHKPCPDGSTAEGHIKVTDRIAGQKKVFWKRQKAEAAGTEGGPRNTLAPFRLQDFMCFKISKHTVLLLLVLLAFPVNSNEISKQTMCAVCPEPRCATIVTRIWLKGNDDSIWKKQDEEIPQCFNDNLKSDKPCQGPNGSLVLRTENELEFEWKNLTSSDAKLISSVNMPCDKLNLPPSSTPSPGVPHLARITKAPAATNNSVADNKDSGIGGGIGIFIIGMVIGIGIGIGIGFLIWKRKSCGQGQDREPAHDPEDRNENTMEMQSLKGEVANENVNGVH